MKNLDLETREVRSKLAARGKPYWQSIGKGLHIGYRKSARGGVWVVRRYVGDQFVVSEWTATATDTEGRAIEWDGIDVFPFRDGLIARKDVYSGSHSPRVL